MNLLDANDEAGEYPASWYAATANGLSEYPKLSRNLWVKTCVIGAGYSGLSTALHLSQDENYSSGDVCILEAQRIGWGASGRNGGQLGSGQRLDQVELEVLLGRDKAHRLWGLAQESKALVKSLIEKHKFPVDFKPGILHANHRARFNQHSQNEIRLLQDEYGYPSIRYVEREEMREIVDSEYYHGGTLDMDSGHLHPLNYSLGLAKVANEAGCQIYEQSRVIKVIPGHPVKIITENGVVTAENVVFACNGYLGNLDKGTAKRVMPINNFIVATQPLAKDVATALIRDDIAVADSKFVVNYFRLSADNRLLFGGRESYGYRFPRDIKKFVRTPMLQIFPQLADTEIEYGWGGTLAITMNRLPYFGRADNICSISGYSGHGVGMATLAGKLVARAICGDAQAFEEFRSIGANKFPGGVALRTPLLVLAMLYHSLLDKF